MLYSCRPHFHECLCVGCDGFWNGVVIDELSFSAAGDLRFASKSGVRVWLLNKRLPQRLEQLCSRECHAQVQRLADSYTDLWENWAAKGSHRWVR